MRHCDILICGAGISGLLLASELSARFSVIVLEKSPQSDCSNKFWVTSKDCLAQNEELRACVDSEWDEMDFIGSDRTKFTAKGQYVLWNTRSLEKHLIDKIRRNGSELFYEHRFYSYRYTGDGIMAYANNLAFQASLIIDCMGYSSPIVTATNAARILGYYHLYGRVIRLKKPVSLVAADNVLLAGQPSYLEVFPRSDGFANVVLIAPAKSISSYEKLERDFNFIVEQSHYAEYFSEPKTGDKLQGIVSVGQTKKRSLDRIFFFGEAGQLHPAASCTCLTKLLGQYKHVSESVAQALNSGRLKAKDLAPIAVRMNRFSQKFHQNMYREVLECRSDKAGTFLELLHCLDQKSLDDFIFGELTLAHFFQRENLARVFAKKNFLWVRPLLRSLFT